MHVNVPHLVQACSCGKAWATEITAEQATMEPKELARHIEKDKMVAYLAFCDSHEAKGHELGALYAMAFAPMPEA